MFKHKKRLIAVSLLISCLLAGSYFLYGWFNPPKTVSTTPARPGLSQESVLNSLMTNNKSSINILSLGDSIAKGTGNEKGLSIADYFSSEITGKTSKKVSKVNLATNGADTGDFLSKINEPDYREQIKKSDIIMLSIGGNNIIRLVLKDIGSAADRFNDIEAKYLGDLNSIVQTIRKDNKDCYIAFIGLYYPNYMKFPPLIKLLNNWNEQTREVIIKDKKAFFVPTYDVISQGDNNYFSSDNLHPNSKGYEAIAQKLTNLFQGVVH